MKRSYKFADSLIKNYGRRSVFYKYWKKILLYTLIPFTLFCLAIYIIVLHNTEQKLFSTATSEFEKNMLLLNSIISDSYDKYDLLNADDYVTLFLISPTTDSPFYSDYKVTDRLRHSLLSYTTAPNTIKSIDLYSYANNCIFSSQTLGQTLYKNNIEWISNFQNQDEPMLALADGPDAFRFVFSCGPRNHVEGLISISFKTNDFIEKINTFSNETEVCLYDTSAKSVLFGNENILNNFDMTQKNSKTKMGNEYFFHAETIFPNVSFFVKCKNVSSGTNFSILLIIIACVLFSLALSAALSFYLSLQFYRSIAIITTEMQKVFGENDISNEKSDELKYISIKLVELISKHKEIEKELVEKISSLRRYQTIMLQNQFNPHFLFNTLNSVIMILNNQKLTDERPIEMISLLCKLMRGALNTEHYIIALEKELKYAQDYIDLERIKHKDSFDVEYHIDHTLLSQNIIKFILQPILENAFTHGINKLPSTKRGKVSLSISRQKKTIIISIADNGPGMDEETLLNLQKQFQKEDLLSSKHIGLCNTNNRIRIFYGEDYGITEVISSENGTEVKITIPFEK